MPTIFALAILTLLPINLVRGATPVIVYTAPDKSCYHCNRLFADYGYGNDKVYIAYIRSDYPSFVTGLPTIVDVKTGRHRVGYSTKQDLESWLAIPQVNNAKWCPRCNRYH